MWLVVPLGNIGNIYSDTRHNFGRLMFNYWLSTQSFKRNIRVIHQTKFGKFYSLSESLHVLVPQTYMNLSGLACNDALKIGYDLQKIIVVYDDKDLLLGNGRFRITGSAGGHNGLQSILDIVGSRDILRLRLGIGPFKRPLMNFVLEKWTKEERMRINGMHVVFDNFLNLIQNTTSLNTISDQVNSKLFWTY